MIFTKMQINGNDFIYVNCLETKIKDPKTVSRETCNRRFGVGADGLVLITMSKKADYKIEIYNSDGSRAKMCGNALLLLGKYLYESEYFKLDLENKKEVNVETDSGIKKVALNIEYNEIKSVMVNMGKVDFNGNENINLTDNIDYNIHYLSIGNLHGVVILDDIEIIDIYDISDKIKKTIGLSDDLNIEYIKIINKDTIKMKIFERGVGETLSCGSGACVAVALAVKNGYCEPNRDIKVITPGGEHSLKYLDDHNIIIEGEPKIVYNGYLRI